MFIFGVLCPATAPALAIDVQLGSASQVPFSSKYPEHARAKIRHALSIKSCRFIDGATTMHQTTLNFDGNTIAINEMLKKLTQCPGIAVSVSFRKIEHDCDWQLVYTTDGCVFRAIVNLDSDQIDLEDLEIPPSMGPTLLRQPLPDPVHNGG
jgi:hypothetical protein